MELNNLKTIIKNLEAYECKLLAVVKNQNIENIKKLVDYGVNDLGENRLDELIEHSQNIPNQNFHFIAPIQSRKLPEILKHSVGIHSVFRKKELDIISKNYNHQELFVQVNVDGDKNKSGLNVEQLFEFIKYAKGLNIMPKGLMCIPNIASDRQVVFSKMQYINEQLKNEFQDYQGELSMGMSDDYEIALDYGATIVRIGSKIFI